MRAHCLPACRCERAKLFPPARAPALTHPARLASAARHHPGQPPAPSGQPLWSTSLTIPSCLPRCRWRPVPSPPPQRSHPLRAPKPPRPPQPPRPPRPPQPQPSVLTSCKARNDVHFAPCQDTELLGCIPLVPIVRLIGHATSAGQVTMQHGCLLEELLFYTGGRLNS